MGGGGGGDAVSTVERREGLCRPQPQWENGWGNLAKKKLEQPTEKPIRPFGSIRIPIILCVMEINTKQQWNLT